MNAAALIQHENPAGGPVLQAGGKITASLRRVQKRTSFTALAPHQSCGIKREVETGLIWISWTSTTWKATQLDCGFALFNCSPFASPDGGGEGLGWAAAVAENRQLFFWLADYFSVSMDSDAIFLLYQRSSYCHNAAASVHGSLRGDASQEVVGSTARRVSLQRAAVWADFSTGQCQNHFLVEGCSFTVSCKVSFEPQRSATMLGFKNTSLVDFPTDFLLKLHKIQQKKTQWSTHHWIFKRTTPTDMEKYWPRLDPSAAGLCCLGVSALSECVEIRTENRQSCHLHNGCNKSDMTGTQGLNLWCDEQTTWHFINPFGRFPSLSFFNPAQIVGRLWSSHFVSFPQLLNQVSCANTMLVLFFFAKEKSISVWAKHLCLLFVRLLKRAFSSCSPTWTFNFIKIDTQGQNTTCSFIYIFFFWGCCVYLLMWIQLFSPF